MSIAVTQLTLATVLLASLAVPAAAESDTGVCSDQTTIVAPPGGGISGLWLNDCILLGATAATITLRNADPIGHWIQVGSCIGNAPNGIADTAVNAGGSRDHVFEIFGSTVKITTAGGSKICSLSDVAPRDAGRNAPQLPVIEKIDGATRIHYICGFHGATMHGTITLGA